MFFGLFRKRKKKKKTSGSRADAKDRLNSIVSSRRRSVPIQDIVPQEVLDGSEADVKNQIKHYVSEKYNVNEENVKVQFEEHNGYVVRITNVVFH